MRIPYAMRAMINEIEQVNNKAVLETRHPDGFGVWRTLVLDTPTTELLTPLLDELSDKRILAKDLVRGQYMVTFVADRRADIGTQFSLDKAYRVLTVDESPAEGERRSDGPTRAQRRRELSQTPVVELRSKYNFPDDVRKREIVDDILRDEGY